MYLTSLALDIIQFCVLLVFVLFLLPQLLIICKKKSSATTSPTTFTGMFVLFLIGTAINWYIRTNDYGFNIGMTLITLMLLLITIFTFKYRKS